MRDRQQVSTQTQDDRNAGGGLNALAVEPMPEEFGNRQGAASPEVAAEKQCAIDVSRNPDRGPNDVCTTLPCVGKTSLAEECVGAEHTGDERADDQQRRCLTTDHKVVFEILDLPPRIISDEEINENTREDADRVDVQV